MQYAADAAVKCLADTDIPYEVIRSNRKSYAIKILPDGSIQLRVPQRTSQKAVQEILMRHRTWMMDGSRKQREKFSSVYEDGHFVPFLGKRLIIQSDVQAHMEEDIIYLSAEHRTEQLVAFYRQAAKQYLPIRLQYWAEKLGLSVHSVHISGAKTRWGSCSSKQNINFSYRVMMLSEHCIDYVIVHELCHLKQMNHSAAFWSEVAAVLPDYKEREQQIKQAFLIIL